MFKNASAFNQPIGDWNTSSVTEIKNIFFALKNISIENECKIIDGWNKTESEANAIYITGGNSGFSFSQCLSSKDFSITMDKDTSHTFAQNDFNFTDYLGGTFDSIYITSLPLKEELNLSSSLVVANQKILVGDIVNLVYIPIANEFGDSYAQFGFIVHNSDDKNSTAPPVVVVPVVIPDKVVEEEEEEETPTIVEPKSEPTEIVKEPAKKGYSWLNDLDKGYIERPLFILAIINGAKGDDLEMLQKQTIAYKFLTQEKYKFNTR